MINSVTLGGNLTSDSTLRMTQSGNNVLSFGIAVNERRKNAQTGEWGDVPSFFDVTLFGSRAEKLCGYLTKGVRVVVVGFLRQSSWEKDGNRHSKVEVIAEDVMFMSPRNDQQQAPAYSAPQQAPTYSAPQQAPAYSAPAPQQQYVQPQQFQQVAQQMSAPSYSAPQPTYEVPLADEDIPFD